MLTSTTHTDGSTLTLQLAGDLTLEHSAELHALLLQHKDTPSLKINLTEATRIDLTGLQLFDALIRSRDRDNTPLEFDPLPEIFIATGAALGAGTLMASIIARTPEAA